MGTRDPRVDAYIRRSAEFAQPILTHLRELVHRACPQARETIKWGIPHFEYHGVLCSMAAFKAHCAFGFWHREVGARASGRTSGDAMGQFGRITRVSDLPRDSVLKQAVREAAQLNASGVKTPRAGAAPKPPVSVPEDLAAALAAHPKALATFEAFSQSHRREYVDWIIEARREATRARRIATSIEWLTQGKSKEWRYR
jgi:uncharacterized protein YdeI (YjbR/CyaY-like superfamily)